MNYRHHYHAGNYADVFKHVLLLQLIRAMQRKEKGFLYLDTHAGRGGYDLSVPSVLPDGRAREAEFPAGIGRLWDAAGLPPGLNDFVALVRRFNDRNGATGPELKFYPGSPWIAKLLLRPQDRMALCELREDDAEALDFEFARESRVTVQVIDGYTGLKALLPPPEKRALVLIDPPFESKKEFADIARGLKDALKRLPGAVCAVWYPITERARTAEFHHALLELATPTLFAELTIAGEALELKMKGCGLLMLNPPWQIDREIRFVLPALREQLKVDAGAATACGWLVPEK
ncbi:MAG: 23S rRNA (adenine(2030)-N(6))-methyltransferase RlmJ [bacterium]|nr:23S rRNA (adenine(2030)-N(6))-methyltransferase RlmJ [bacterium]MDI1334603.1 23S rRNA (adenine(2030)-N(6))-methyltransferase RlmJ [Lacunisphaera sp.]